MHTTWRLVVRLVFHAFEYAFDGCLNHQGVRRQWLCNPIVDVRMTASCLRNFHRNIAACVSPGREKIWMNRNVACSSLDQPREPFGNVRMFDLKEGSFDQHNAATLADGAGCLSHIFVCFRATTAVTHDQNARNVTMRLVFHAATPDSWLNG